MEGSCKSVELAVLIKRMHIKSYFAIKDRVGMIKYYPHMEGIQRRFKCPHDQNTLDVKLNNNILNSYKRKHKGCTNKQRH